MTYYSDPNLGHAFEGLSTLFSPVSGSDAAGYATAIAARQKSAQLGWLFNHSDDATAAARAALTGVQTYGATPAGFAAEDATRRYGVDQALAGTKYTADATAKASLERQGQQDKADTERAILTALTTPVAQGATRYVPPAIADQYGVSAQQPGNVAVQPGERVYSPDGKTYEGVPKPLDESQWKAQQAQDLRARGILTDDTLLAAIFGNTPLQTVQTPDGPRMVTTPQAIGQAPQSTAARPMSSDERTSFGVPQGVGAYVDASGKPGVLGASGTTVNVGGATPELRKALDEKEGQAWAGLLDAATTSGNSKADLDMLGELAVMAPQGPIVGRLAQALPGFSAAGDAFQSIVKRVAPTLRATGSGSTSDIEYDGMLKALPSLSNSPTANQAILAMLQAKAGVNLQRGDVINAYQNNHIDAAEARRQLATINKASILTPELRTILGNLTQANSSASAPVASSVPSGSSTIPTPQTQADFDALPSGASFRDPSDGKLYRKP